MMNSKNEKKFIAAWHIGTKQGYCNLPYTDAEVSDDMVILKRDGEFVGQFDRGFVDMCYFTETIT